VQSTTDQILTGKIVSELTYNVSSGMINRTIPFVLVINYIFRRFATAL